MRCSLIIRLSFVLVFYLSSGLRTGLYAQQRGVQLPVTACLQYQKVKSKGGNLSGFFHRYGMRQLVNGDNSSRLWGFHVRLDSTWTKSQPPYRIFQKHDIYSFAVIDGRQPNSPCQYVFWWKGYYRRFADDLRRMGFVMSNDKYHTNILCFTRKDVDIVVNFIIWEDIYVMQLSFK